MPETGYAGSEGMLPSSTSRVTGRGLQNWHFQGNSGPRSASGFNVPVTLCMRVGRGWHCFWALWASWAWELPANPMTGKILPTMTMAIRIVATITTMPIT
jgi:hypothetical protein